MSEGIGWTILVIAIVPLAVIAVSELEERLRQHDSSFRGGVGVIRNWALPLFAIWAVLIPLVADDGESFWSRAVASGLVLALAIATLRLMQVVINGLQTRPRVDGRGAIPQLVLALPRIAVVLFVAWMLLKVVWGVDLSAALTALGVTSLVVSFALQDTLSGLASGVLLLSDQPFQPGDWIESDDTEGLVVDLNWRTTRIRTRNGDLVIVPNSQLANASIVNYSTPEPLHRVTYPVQVAFSNPPTLAKEMLLDAARNTPGVLSDPAPTVFVIQTDDPLMGYQVNMWVSDYSIVPQVQSDFGSLVWYQSHRHEVPLPSPAQDLYLHDPIAEAEAARPDDATIRRWLHRSPLLALLEDSDIDRLVRGSRPVRYAAGELMIESKASRRDLMVIVEGRALLVLIEPGHDDAVIGEVSSGETVGILEGPRDDSRLLAVRAVTDCDVLVVDAEAAGEVGSRNADLAAAFNRMSSIRARRIDRAVAARQLPSSTPDPVPDSGSSS